MVFDVILQLSLGKLAIVEQKVDDLQIPRILIVAYHHAMQTGVAIDALGIDVDFGTDFEQLAHHLNIFVLNSYV